MSEIISGNIPDDTIKVKLLYSLAVASSSIDAQDHKYNNIQVNSGPAYCFEAFKLSNELNYKYGQDHFYRIFPSLFNQRTIYPIIGFTDYYFDLPLSGIKDFRYFKNQIHHGALDTYSKTIDTLSKWNYTQKLYLFEYYIGLIYYDWFNFSRAIKYFKKITCDSIASYDNKIKCDVFQFLGTSYSYKGNQDSAIIFLKKSYELQNKSDHNQAGINLINIGEAYILKRDFASAIKYFNNALPHLLLLPDSLIYSYALNEVGRVYIKLKEYEKARSTLLQSINISLKSGNKIVLYKAYSNISDLYFVNGDIESSLIFLKKMNKVRDELILDEIKIYSAYNDNRWQNEIGREITKKESEALKKNETIFKLGKSRIFALLLALFLILIGIVAVYNYKLYRLKQKANRYLIELNRSREKLLSIISHDVRGPIVGLIDLLEPLNQQVQNLSSMQISRHIRQIIDLSQNIRFLLDNLLEWTKIQQGIIGYNPGVFYLNDLINLNLNIYQPIARSKGISLRSEISDNIDIVADRNMINVILRNLLNNAVKFTSTGGAIKINAHKTNQMIYVSVADTGIGMDKSLIELFSYESDNIGEPDYVRKFQGIGLSLCKEYVKKCGGNIWIESEGKDCGTTFFITLKSK